MKEIDTIRKVLEFYAQGDWNGDPAKKALAALSTIDPDAIRRDCADRAVAWYNAPRDPLYEYEDDDEYWNESLRAAILATEPAREVDRYPFYDPDKQTLVWKDAQGNVWERLFKDGAWGEKWIIKEATRTEPAREES